MFLPAQHELLLEIIERPDDDALRQVLADTLNDAGDPLGELISVQCMISRIEDGRASGDWRALKVREHQLMRQHRATWHQAAAPFAQTLIMRRGLPYALHCSSDALLADGGLTVLAPIQQLELERVHPDDLEHLFALPLLKRVSGLALLGLARLPQNRVPPPLPPNIVRLELALDGLRSLAHAVEVGLLDGIEELELGARWLGPDCARELHPPVLPKLRKLVFSGLHATERTSDERWHRELAALLEERPDLVIGWRGIQYEQANLAAMLVAHEPQFMEDPVPRPASEYNREPFGEPERGTRIDTGAPTTVELWRLPDGGTLAKSRIRPDLSEVMQSISLDAAVQLQLPRLPGVLTALSFALDWDTMAVRYERFAYRTLWEVQLPLPVPIALAVVQGLAHAMVPLRDGLRSLGIPGWPRMLSRDFVLLGHGGTVKLVPPFGHCVLDDLRSDMENEHRALGLGLDPDLDGTDEGMLVLLGSTLSQLVAGEPLLRRVRPGALNAEWKVLDPLVEGCLSKRRASLHQGVDGFLRALNALGLTASQDAVAKAASREQSLSP